MQHYRWKGINHQGASVKGIEQAASAEHLKIALRRQGIAVLWHKEQHPTKYGWLRRKTPISQEVICDFFDNLGLLVNNGIELVKALETITKLPHNKALKNMSQKLALSVTQGKSFHDALKEHPATFQPLVTSIIAASEQTGMLGKALEGLHAHFKQNNMLRRHLRQAAQGPLLTLTTACILVGIVLVIVLPHFSTLYQSLNKPIPPATKMLFTIQNVITSPQFFGGTILALFGCNLSHKLIKKNGALVRRLHVSMLRLPFIGRIIIYTNQIIFMQTIQLFTTSGLTLACALEHAQEITQNMAFKSTIQSISQAIQEGKTLHSALEQRRSPFFDEQFIALIQVGEQSGHLSTVLKNTINQYRNELTHHLESVTTMLTPLLMIVIGFLIGSLMIVIYLPIFNLGHLFT